MTRTPKTLTVMESNALLDALFGKRRTQKQKRRGIRNFTMGLTMLDVGLRVGELVKLRISDLQVAGSIVNSLRITGDIAKGGRERIVPLSDRVRHAIELMQVHYWSAADKFVNYWAFGAINSSTHVTTRQVERIVRSAAMAAIGRPIHPHVLRHTFASRLMRTTNIRVVQELLGHQHVTTTQIYTHPNQEDLKKAIDNLEKRHPTKTYLPSTMPVSPNAANNIYAAGTDGDVT